MTVDLDLVADPAAELAYRRQIDREAYERGLEDGYAAGAVAMAESYKRGLKRTVAKARLEAARWLVECRSCRTNGRRDGCTRCEIRDRETYADPHPDDYQPTRPRLEAAS
jgi:hypothetical protein